MQCPGWCKALSGEHHLPISAYICLQTPCLRMASVTVIDRGEWLYHQYCQLCPLGPGLWILWFKFALSRWEMLFLLQYTLLCVLVTYCMTTQSFFWKTHQSVKAKNADLKLSLQILLIKIIYKNFLLKFFHELPQQLRALRHLLIESSE